MLLLLLALESLIAGKGIRAKGELARLLKLRLFLLLVWKVE
jgi:hypothetical protein